MSQRFSLYDDLTVAENLRFFGRTYSLKRDQLNARIQFVLNMADLVGREKSRARELSGGWRQRLALGAAILHEPELIFLDEPTSGVDPISRRQFWDLIYELSGQGVSVFVTTHYMDEAEYCDRLGMIYRGQLIALDTPRALKTAMMKTENVMPSLEDVFVSLIEAHDRAEQPQQEVQR
jgi:ABC-2 type transport system ATP-binding protein